jgi:glucosamine--fructose-6-phosphate aminotransferase (isomerizing)
MCGIFGYTGSRAAWDVVLNGLRRLEYRGYDSAGIASLNNGKLSLARAVGRVDALAAKGNGEREVARTAIGHTRWATHGRPTERNAHPHLDGSGRIAVVHNGIIENYATLRAELTGQGARFASETDTEAAAMLIGKYYRGDLLTAVEEAVKHLEGAYAFAIISADHPGLVVGARRGSPLVIGDGNGKGEMFLASDAVPIAPYTQRILFLEDGQVAALRPGKLVLRHDGREVTPRFQELRWDTADAERGGYPHYMLKEIHEQPCVLRRLAANLVAQPGCEASSIPPHFKLDELARWDETFKRINRITIVAQGTALHAGLVGRNMLERTARLPVSVEYGSDFRYRDPVIDSNVLVIAVSQSGETADTLGAVRLARERGCPTLSVINAPGSSIVRESDAVIYTDCGPEIGVASTKAFTAQIAALYVLAIHLGLLRQTLPPGEAARRVTDLLCAPVRVEDALARSARIQAVAEKYKNAQNAFFLGRGTGFPLALEGALKLKEISYIHAEGYDAAEMKHGPIALIDEKMPVVVLALKGRRYEKILSNIAEVKARGGHVIAIASCNDDELAGKVDDVLYVPDDRGIMNSLACAVPLQLFAYYIAAARGCDVDKPRNLAKSVTVE